MVRRAVNNLTERFGADARWGTMWLMRRFRPGLPITALLLLQPLAAFAAPVPRGAQRVPLLSVVFTVPCSGDATLSSLTIRHTGAGDAADIDGVYVEQAGKRVSTVATFTHGLTTPRLRNLVLPRCTETRLEVMGDVSETAAPDGVHVFRYVSAELHGAFPVQVMASVPAGVLNVRAGDSLAQTRVDILPLLLPITYGTQRGCGSPETRAKTSNSWRSR